MKSTLSHIQFNIDFKHVDFYTDLMKFLGWAEIYAADGVVGYNDSTDKGASIWFLKSKTTDMHGHGKAGMNHIGIHVDTQSDVDSVVGYIKDKNIKTLYDTPRHRPEFAFVEGNTYYQVMFESPDKILFEVVYTGPKN
ncbi:VOC family protein [Candidatus Woesebacteria bacterium]|nr:VOC family protein [Candidatus Woesebacteria bacterium]